MCIRPAPRTALIRAFVHNNGIYTFPWFKQHFSPLVLVIHATLSQLDMFSNISHTFPFRSFRVWSAHYTQQNLRGALNMFVHVKNSSLLANIASRLLDFFSVAPHLRFHPCGHIIRLASHSTPWCVPRARGVLLGADGAAIHTVPRASCLDLPKSAKWIRWIVGVVFVVVVVAHSLAKLITVNPYWYLRI